MTEDLKSHLRECAEILRGSAVDRTDWKAYFSPLLVFKRISDVWGEETAEAATLFGDAEPVDFPEVHRFNVPVGCHWRDVRGVALTCAPLAPTPCARSSARIPTLSTACSARPTGATGRC